MTGISGSSRSNVRLRSPSLTVMLFLIMVTVSCSSGAGVNKGTAGSDRGRGVSPEPTEPARRDPATYRTGVLAPIVRTVPGAIQRGIFTAPEEHIEGLVRHLVSGERDEYKQVKNIHDWIADNIAYDADSYFSGSIPGQSYAAVLRNRSSVCEGYAGLFKTMCDLAGIECVKVSGYARGYGYSVFDDEDVTKTNHAWNAVRIDDEWHLVDATWNAGHVDGSSFIKRYSTKYLFLEPEKMIHTHYPADAIWQLIEPAIPAGDFMDLPQLVGWFFHYDIDLPMGTTRLIHTGEQYQMRLRTGEDVFLMANVFGADGVQHRAFIQKQDGDTEITFRFPGKGEWTALIYAKSGDEERYSGCAYFGFIASEGTDRSFPLQYSNYFDRNCYLFSPTHNPLTVGSTETFRLRLPGAISVAILAEEEWTYLVQSEEGGDEWTGEFIVPETDQVIVYGKWEGQEQYNGIMAFEVGKRSWLSSSRSPE
ncbi:transglutaminase domain-containing protein [Gemmatimonadota bacterium]